MTVFKDSQAGSSSTIWDWRIELKKALANYTESGGSGRAASTRTRPSPCCKKYEICCGIFADSIVSLEQQADAATVTATFAQEHVLRRTTGSSD